MDAAADVAADVVTTDSPADSGGCTAAAIVNGTLLGSTMNAKDAFFLNGDPSMGNWGFVITDYTGACTKAEANWTVSSSKNIVFLYNQAPAPGVGTSPVGSATPWYVGYHSFDSTCTATPDLAVSGTITLSSIDSCGVSATFDLTFGGSRGTSNEHVTGSVTAPACAPPGADAGASTCH